MTHEQAQKMVAMLDSLVKLAILPMPPHFYNPEEECTLDVSEVYALSIIEGDDRGEYRIQCAILPIPNHEARAHYNAMYNAVEVLTGIEVTPSGDRTALYMTIDLADHDHIREAF